MCVLRRKVLVMATRDMMEQMKVRAVTMAMTAETQKKKQHSPEYEKKNVHRCWKVIFVVPQALLTAEQAATGIFCSENKHASKTKNASVCKI